MAFLGGENLVPDIVAVVGVLVWCAGLHLLWISRHDLLAWIEEYVRLFRISMNRVADPAHARLELASEGTRRKHTMRIVLGVVLAFFLAPMLITLGLAF